MGSDWRGFDERTGCQRKPASGICLVLWWIALYGTFSSSWPRPFDDWKNTLFYLGAGFFILLHRRKEQKSLNPPLFFLTLYLGLGLVSIQDGAYEGYLAAARLILWVGFAGALTSLSEGEFKSLFRFLVPSAALIAAMSWAKQVGLSPWPSYSDSPFLLPPVGHMTYYGDFMALHIPLALSLIRSETGRRSKVLGSVCLLLIFSGLLLSGTRSSLLGLMTGLLLGTILLTRSKGIARRGVLMSLGVGLGLLLTIAFLPPVGPRGTPLRERLIQPLQSVREEGIKGLFPGRWRQFANTVRMIEEKPVLGWGLGSFRFSYPEFVTKDDQEEVKAGWGWLMHPHNELLHQGAENGILGLFAFAGFWVLTIFYGLRTRRSILPLVGITIALVSWQFSTSYLFPLSRLLLALYAAILWKEIAPVMPQVAVHRGLVRPLVVVILASTLLLGTYQASLFATRRSQPAQSVEARLFWTQWAVRLAPYAFDPLYQAAAVYHAFGWSALEEPILERLHQHYPFVPAILYKVALLRLSQGEVAGAINLLEHAVRNAPNFGPALELLAKLKGAN